MNRHLHLLCYGIALTLTSLLAPNLSFAQQADAVLVADQGKLRLYSGEAQQTLLECQSYKQYQLVVEPYSMRTHTQPCYIDSLTTDEKTGRWAVSIDASPSATDEDYALIINGKRYEVPRDKKGRGQSSGLLVYGDAQGIKQVWPGILKAYDKKDRLLFQYVVRFSEDGSRLWVKLLNGSGHTELWSWSLDAKPKGAQVKAPPVMTDKESGLVLVPGEPFVIREHSNDKLRLAHVPADGAAKLERVSKLTGAKKSWVVPVILGDEVFYYVPGEIITKRIGRHELPNQCDPSRTGTYRRMNIKTGLESTWRTHQRCLALGSLFVPPHKNTPALFFKELDERALTRIYRLDLATSAVSEVGVRPDSEVLAITPAATRMLVTDRNGGVSLWDMQRSAYVWGIPTGKAVVKAVFTRGESPRAAQATQP